MGSRDVIRYGPATLAALIRELAEPITSAITNPAPIERGLVMDRRVHPGCVACDAVSTVDRCPQCGGASVHEGRS